MVRKSQNRYRICLLLSMNKSKHTLRVFINAITDNSTSPFHLFSVEKAPSSSVASIGNALYLSLGNALTNFSHLLVGNSTGSILKTDVRKHAWSACRIPSFRTYYTNLESSGRPKSRPLGEHCASRVSFSRILSPLEVDVSAVLT